VTFLVVPAQRVEVRLGLDGTPAHLRGGPLVGDLQPVAGWKAELDWWSNPVSRQYWRVLLSNTLLCEIYQDLHENAWYVERIYD